MRKKFEGEVTAAFGVAKKLLTAQDPLSALADFFDPNVKSQGDVIDVECEEVYTVEPDERCPSFYKVLDGSDERVGGGLTRGEAKELIQRLRKQKGNGR